MAAILKREYGLVDLKVCLEKGARAESITCTLEANEGGITRPVRQWRFSTTELGLPRSSASDLNPVRGFYLPPQWLDELRQAVFQKLQWEGTFWLHLARPYGLLGMLPWEQRMQPALGLPVVRLPDFITTPPLESAGLDVVLCASAPLAKGPMDAATMLRQIISKVHDAVPRPTRLHIFSDLETQHALGSGMLAGVTVYPAEEAASYATPRRDTDVPESIDRVTNPWLLWIRDALKGRSIDAVHFVGHGYLSFHRGAIAVAESPVRNEDMRMARFIGTAEFITFLTQIGAWSAAFSSPPGNYSPGGLRLFADTLSQLRPVSVLYHDMDEDHGCTLLPQAYRLLYSPQREMPPASPHLFCCCQPYRVLDAHMPAPAEAAEAAEGADWAGLVQDIKGAQNVPAWVASSQRFLDECKWKIQRLEQADPDGTSTEVRAQKEGIRQAMHTINNTILSAVRLGGHKF